MSDPITRLNAALSGRYRIERKLGEGGMATVYLARDERHNRNVALKVLKPELAAVVGADRFLAEIETTANLQHPHILALFDSGETGGFLYYVMPYVEGESLRQRLDRERQLPVDEAVGIATKVAGALGAAHERGVVHRDIKPANILLSKGEPLVSDFGIALAVGAAGGGRLTETGLSVGTPYYMSPEQATGELSVGPAADVYALGCVLYEMLVGSPPFVASTPQAVLGKIVTSEAPSARAERRSVPANCDAAIRKALEKVPADRFASAVDFAKALGDPAFRHGVELAGTVGAAAASWKRMAVALAVLWGLTASLAGAALLRRSPSGPVARFEVSLGDGGGSPGSEVRNTVFGIDFALSADGSGLVWVAGSPDGAGRQLWQRTLDDLESTPIPGTVGANSPSLSPDGLSVAFEAQNGIRTVSLRGGPPSVLDPQGASPAWGSDGSVYYTRERVIYRFPASVGEPAPFTVPTWGVQSLPDLLPDGRGLLLTVAGTNPNQSRIAVVGPEGGEVREILTGVTARYALSGHVVYVTADGTLWAAPFDLKRLEVTGPEVALAEGIQVKTDSEANFALSRSGTLLYGTGVTHFTVELVWVSRSGEAEPVEPGWSFLLPNAGNLGWRLSPDGKRLAFSKMVDGNEDIWIKDLPDGVESRLTRSPAVELMPHWAPDGLSLTFRSDRDGRGHLWSRKSDGTGVAEVLFDADAVVMGFWSPGGDWLVLRRAGAQGNVGARDILAFRPGVDSAAIPLVADGTDQEEGPALSPDGRWLAYTSTETGRPEVFVRPFPDVDSGKYPVSRDGGIRPLWAPGGDELFFFQRGEGGQLGGGPGAMMVARVRTEPTFEVLAIDTLYTLPEGYVSSTNGDFYDVTPDGQRFLMGRVVESARTVSRYILVQNFLEELRRLVPD